MRPRCAAVVRHLVSFGELARPTREGCELGEGLKRYERPLPQVTEYDLLLAEVARVARVRERRES
jgi:hypothetical protein